MNNPNDLQSMRNYWAEVEYYLSNITSEDMEAESNIKNSIPILSLYLSPFTLELLSDDNKNKLIDYLFKIRSYFINKKNYTLSPQHCKEVKDLVNELKNYFNQIGGNIPNLAILEKYENAIKAQQQDIQNRASELFGELTTHSISKPFKEQFDKYSNSKLNCVFWGLLLVLFIWILSFDGMTNCLNLLFQNHWEKILFRIFSSIPIIWGIFFVSRRISENKKIEQTYLHKYTVAQSYLNYLSFIKMDSRYLRDQEEKKQALQILHRVAMDSLGLNPALLLEKSTAEKIPMEELLSKVIDKSIASNKTKE